MQIDLNRRQRTVKSFFSRGNMNKSAYFDLYLIDNLLKQIKAKIVSLDNKERAQKSFEYYHPRN